MDSQIYLRIFQGLANHSMLDKNCSQYQFVGPATFSGIVGRGNEEILFSIFLNQFSVFHYHQRCWVRAPFI